MKSPIIVIAGPTASGKTVLGIDLAKEFKGEIICVDSMTVYRGMDIGTDKMTIQNSKFKIQNENSEIKVDGIKHHMLDILEPNEDFNVSMFKNLAEKEIKEIHARKHVSFLVGGAILYIDALAYNYDIPHAKPNLRLRKELEKKSNEELFNQLIKLDPDAEMLIDRNNKRRLIRALEVSIQAGKPFTKQRKKQKLPENVLYLALATDRQELYERINKRVDEMMAAGLLDEVEALYKKYDLSVTMQATGYKQLVQHIRGEISLEEAVGKTKQAHRNYAKRQLTWLRSNPDVVWIRDKKEAERKVKVFLKKV